jgi:hypothetical protein
MKEIKIATLQASTLTELQYKYEDFKNNHDIIVVEIIGNRISADWFEMMIIYKEV